MHIPCPHCQKGYRFNPDLFHSPAVKLKCPSCEGVFLVEIPSRAQDTDADLEEDISLVGTDDTTLEFGTDDDFEEAAQELGSEPEVEPEPPPTQETAPESPKKPAKKKPKKEKKAPARKRASNKKLKTVLWIACSCFALLVALVAILLPTTCQKDDTDLLYHTEKDALDLAEAKPFVLDPKLERLIYANLWPYTPREWKAPCRRFFRLQDEKFLPGQPEENGCQVYPLWITYLSFENTLLPPCRLDSVYDRARARTKDGTLCAQGYAFLCLHHLQGNAVDRSRSALEEALKRSPEDPWVQCAEAIYYRRIQRDEYKAHAILLDLLKKNPAFPLARYLLADLLVSQDDYGKARDLLIRFQKDFPEQPAFQKIIDALTFLAQASHYSTVKARGLMDLGAAFLELQDYALVEKIYGKVLREMPGRVPNEELKMAYYKLGRIYELRGKKQHAHTSYKTALEIDPTFEGAAKRIHTLLYGEEDS